MKSLIVLGTLLAILSAAAMPIGAEQPPPAAVGKLADQLHSWKIRVLPADEKNPPSRMLADDVRQGLRDANRRETRAWRELKNLDDWKNYVQPRIQALRKSLGQFPPPPKSLSVRVTKQLKGDGYWIDNIVFESRPGLLVTANLYLPARNVASMPGMLICHSHHNPKTQGELQDMGILWARLGCAVLVMDQLGHGERRQHPFINAGSYPKSFRVGRQDYYFRYNTGMQLYLVGESLSGWMAWDLMRGVDVLLMQPNIDPKKIVLLGAVAGGGDPAAAAGALDERITAVVPFNFGGPQPETTYPLPPNAEDSFNYAGGGSWESTRNLRLSARDGFLPWVIVGSIAPRRLIYGHEFTWDRDHDPVWARLQQIYRWYDVPDHLAFAHGRGKLSGQPPESSHCNNIGPVHRQLIYAALQRWFAIPPPAKENQERRSAEELQCLTEESKQKGKLACQLAREMGQKQVQTYRQKLALLPAEQRRRQLQQDWSRVLGWQDASAPKFTATPQKAVPHLDSVQVIAATLHTEPERNIVVPVLLLVPTRSDKKPCPVVVAVAQEGKEAFLQKRADMLAALLEKGVAVCLPDLRGTGETRPGSDRGRQSSATALSASELMLGRTLLGGRCLDLRAVLEYLRQQKMRIDPQHIALWGDSFAPVNDAGRNLAAPLDSEELPPQAEPLGGLVVLLTALFEKEVCAVQAHGGLAGYLSVLDSPFCYLPHDVIVPGVLSAGDVADVAAALAPRPLRLEGFVDGRNRRLSAEDLRQTFAPAIAAFRSDARALLLADPPQQRTGASWLLKHLTN